MLYGLAGVALLVGAGCWFAGAGFDFRQMLMVVLGLAFTAASVFLLRRDAVAELKRSRNAGLQKKEWSKVARVDAELPFDIIAGNFKALAKATDEAVAGKSYLSWNSGAFAEIRIRKIDAETWIALFWLRSDWTLTDRQVEGICRRESVEMLEEFRKMQAHGCAVCSRDSLSIYPASLRNQFEEAFMGSVLLPPAEFTRWLAEYTDDE